MSCTALFRSSQPDEFLGKGVLKVFWKYAANLQENTHAEVRFQKSYFAALLKSHFGMGILQ